MSVNNTNRNANTINGTNGIVIFFLLLFSVRKYLTAPNIAPAQIEIRNTAEPCARPKNAPTPKNSITSPNPKAFPFETIQIKRKGRATANGATIIKKLGSFI